MITRDVTRFNFSIPSQRPPTRESFPTAPRKILQWVSHFEAEPHSYQDELYRGLKHYNRLLVEPKERIEGLEVLRPYVDHLCQHLSVVHTDQPLPLPKSAQDALHQHAHLVKEMAFGYKVAVHDLLQEPGSHHLEPQTLAIARALSHVSDLIVIHAQHYQASPATAWADLKALYLLSLALGSEQAPVHDMIIAPEAAPRSCLDLFKRIVLFALSMPYSLNVGEARKLWHKLPQWTAELSIEEQLPEGAQIEQNGLFCLNRHSDSPPERPHFVDRQDGSDLLWIDTQALMPKVEKSKRIHTHLNHPVSGQDQLHLQTYTNLEQCWRGQQERKEPRGIRNQACHVAFGLQDIAELYRHGERLQHAFPLDKDQVWTLINYSKSGFGLSWSAPSSTRARVGNLSAVLVDEQWRLAVIQWLQFKSRTLFHCGLERLTGAPSAVVIERHYPDQKHSENTHHQALLLAPDKEPLTRLILPLDSYRAGEQVKLITEQRKALEAHLVECLKVGADFVLFAVHIRSK